jgi:hypothetical protein
VCVCGGGGAYKIHNNQTSCYHHNRHHSKRSSLPHTQRPHTVTHFSSVCTNTRGSTHPPLPPHTATTHSDHTQPHTAAHFPRDSPTRSPPPPIHHCHYHTQRPHTATTHSHSLLHRLQQHQRLCPSTTATTTHHTQRPHTVTTHSDSLPPRLIHTLAPSTHPPLLPPHTATTRNDHTVTHFSSVCTEARGSIRNVLPVKSSRASSSSTHLSLNRNCRVRI